MRAGNATRPPTRAIATTPSSSGCRSASSDGPRELAQLVQEKDAAVREARLARAGARPAADDGRRRRRVVRRAKGRVLDERVAGSQHAGDGMDPRHLERLLAREPRQDPRQPACQHRLPGPGWAAEEEVVASRGGDLERAARTLLPADVREVRRRDARLPVSAFDGRGLEEPAEVGGGLREMAHRNGLDPGRLGLGGGLRRADESLPARAERGLRRHERARAPAAARPSRASSPRAASSPSRSGGTCREAARIASAIGRSYPEPSFLSPAGARLTVILRLLRPLELRARIPLRTRSFASWQALSGRPTMANAGTPRWRWASTSTGRASRPTRAWVVARASTTRR